MSAPRLFHVSREAFYCFSNVNSVLSNIRQLHHQTAIQVDSTDVSFSELSICAVCSSFLLTRGESTPFAPFNFMLSKSILNKLRVGFQRHFIIQHINSDCSIQGLPMWPVCFTSNRFSRTFPKVCNCFCRAATQKSSPWHNPLRFPSQLQKKAGHAVPTFMELSFNTSDHVSHRIDAASRVPYMLLQSLANLPTCSCPSGRNV